MAEKEFPSASYLAELRKEGKIATSSLMVKGFLTFFTIGSIFFISKIKLINLYKQNFSIKESLQFFYVPLLLFLVAAIFIGVLQTRGNIKLYNIKFLYEKRSKIYRLISIFARLIIAILLIMAAYLTFFRKTFLPLISDRVDFSDYVISYRSLAIFIISYSVLAILLGFIVSRILFLFSNRVSPDMNELEEPRISKI